MQSPDGKRTGPGSAARPGPGCIAYAERATPSSPRASCCRPSSGQALPAHQGQFGQESEHRGDQCQHRRGEPNGCDLNLHISHLLSLKDWRRAHAWALCRRGPPVIADAGVVPAAFSDQGGVVSCVPAEDDGGQGRFFTHFEHETAVLYDDALQGRIIICAVGLAA